MRLSPGIPNIGLGGISPPNIPQVTRIPIGIQQQGSCAVDLPFDPYSPQWGNQIGRIASYLSSVGEALENTVSGDINALASIVFPNLTVDPLNLIANIARTAIQVAWPAMKKILNSAWKCARTLHIGQGGSYKFVMKGCVFYKTLINAMRSMASTENETSLLSISIGVDFDGVLRIVDYIFNYYSRQDIGGIADIVNGHLKGYLNYEEYIHALRLHGVSPKMTQVLWQSAQSLITEDEVMRLWFQYSREPIKLWKTLQPYGYADFEQIADKIEANKFLPPISDMIRFAIKDVFDPNKPGRSEMMQELAEQTNLLDIFAASGIGNITYKTRNGNLREMDVPLFYWLSSFEEISPEQSFEMLRRLRPERVNKWRLPGQSDSDVQKMIFSLQDTRKLLKERDVNPIYRDRLAAIAYHTMTRIDVRRVYLVHGFGQTRLTNGFVRGQDGELKPIGVAEIELTAQYQDQGYAPNDSARLAYFTAFEVEAQRERPKITKLKAQACQLLQLGTINEQQAKDILKHPLLPESDVDFIVSQCRTEHTIKRTKMATRSIRKRFIHGELNVNMARILLQSLGISDGWINLEIPVWQYEIKARGKEVLASQLSKWYEKGLISRNEFLVRLSNLGYSPQDAIRVIRFSELGSLARNAKERERRLKELVSQRNKLKQLQEKNQRELERDIQEEANQRKKGLSITNLRKWYQLGLINCDDVRRALTLDNWPNENIEMFIKELTTTNKDKPCTNGQAKKGKDKDNETENDATD